MPSSEKTPGLSLNRWLGSDIPQREDFVADNLILDEAITTLQEELASGTGSGSGSGGNDPRLDEHLADTAVHLGESDRAQILKAIPVVGSYTGNGQLSQTIAVGFRPSFGFVYALEEPLVALSPTATYQTARFAVTGREGDSYGVENSSTGFKAYQLTGSTTGATYQGFNEAGVEYAYALWR